jgi:hypothetical protein
MIIKNHLIKIALVGLVGMAFFTQPAQAYESGLGVGFGLPAVGIVSLEGATTPTLLTSGHQKYVKVAPPDDGAVFVVSSVPVVIRTQVSKNIFTANIPNDKGGYSTVIIQKLGNQFRELPVEFHPEVPQLRMMVGE